nr:putative Myb family transcription factor [Ipomoea batatas]
MSSLPSAVRRSSGESSHGTASEPMEDVPHSTPSASEPWLSTVAVSESSPAATESPASTLASQSVTAPEPDPPASQSVAASEPEPPASHDGGADSATEPAVSSSQASDQQIAGKPEEMMKSNGQRNGVRQYKKSALPRRQWTPELHNHFVDTVEYLGGRYSKFYR